MDYVEMIRRRPVAVLRITGPNSRDHRASVKSFVDDVGQAEAEVERLNKLAAEGGSGDHYSYCVARGILDVDDTE